MAGKLITCYLIERLDGIWHFMLKGGKSLKAGMRITAISILASVSFLKKNYGGDLVLLPGDSNEGHWKRDTILNLGRLYYSGMIDSFNKGGYTNLLMAVGDHELGASSHIQAPLMRSRCGRAVFQKTTLSR